MRAGAYPESTLYGRCSGRCILLSVKMQFTSSVAEPVLNPAPDLIRGLFSARVSCAPKLRRHGLFLLGLLPLLYPNLTTVPM